MCGGCHNLMVRRPKCHSNNPALIAARMERQEELRKRQEEERRARAAQETQMHFGVPEQQQQQQQAEQQPQQLIPKAEIKQEAGGSQVRRSKVCGICNGEAETYHLNYGASSCFSCRAFFRRVVQKDSADKLKCKFDGDCELDPKSTTKCRKCRYDRCLTAGMQPGMVLQGSEKITRFRKLITKQMEAEGKLIKRVDTGTGPKKRGRKKKALVSDLPEEFKVGIKLSFKKKTGGGGDQGAMQNVQVAGIVTTPAPASSSATAVMVTSDPLPQTPSPSSSRGSIEGDSGMILQQQPIQMDQQQSYDEVEDLLKVTPQQEQMTVGTPPQQFDEGLFDIGAAAVNNMPYYYPQQDSTGQCSGSEGSFSPDNSSMTSSASPVLIDNGLMDFIAKQVLEDPAAPVPLAAAGSSTPTGSNTTTEPSPAPSFEELMEEVEVERAPGCENKPCVCSKMLCNNQGGCKGGMVDIEAQYSHLLELKTDKSGQQAGNTSFSCLGSEAEAYKAFAANLPQEGREVAWYLKQVQKTWLLACLGTDFDLVAVQNLLLYHFGHREALTLDTLQQHIAKLVLLFHNFAKQQKEFVGLPQMDQAKVLALNAPLFVQYMLARYFTSTVGSEQLRWLLVNGVPTSTRSEDVADALVVDFDAFNESVALFGDLAAGHLYKAHLRDMGQVALPQLTTGHVALSILFHGFEHKISRSLGPIERVLRHANRGTPFSLAVLNSTLQSMADVFEKNTMGLFNSKVTAHQVCLSNSIDEETWLSGVLTAYRDISGSVNLGTDMINEFLMFNLDVPFSRHYTEVLGQIVRERMNRVLAYSQDFQSLNYEDQAAMLKHNVSLCMTLHLARCCGNASQQQVLSLMGKEDRALFDSGKRVLHDRPLRKIALADIAGDMSDADRAKFTALSHSLASYVRDDDLFDVLVHCLLFSSEHVSDSLRVRALESRFFLALERRLVMRSVASHSAVLQKFLGVIRDVKDLSGLITKYFLHVKEEAEAAN